MKDNNKLNITDVLIKSIRPDTLILSLGLTLSGTACALIRGEAEWLPASLCLIFSVFIQCAGNLLHRYHDAANHYGETLDDCLYGMGINGNVNDKMIRDYSRSAAHAALILAATVGLVIMMIGEIWVIIPAILIYGLTYIVYTGPFPIYRTIWSPLMPFLLFGVIGVSTCAMVQINYDNPYSLEWYFVSPTVFSSVAMGLLAMIVQIIHGFDFRDRDEENLKRSIAVKYGRKAAINWVFLCGLGYMVLINIFVYTQIVKFPWVATIVAFIPFSLNTWICIQMKKQKEDDYTDRLARISLYTYLIAAVLMFLFSCCFGDPDRSRLMFT